MMWLGEIRIATKVVRVPQSHPQTIGNELDMIPSSGFRFCDREGLVGQVLYSFRIAGFISHGAKPAEIVKVFAHQGYITGFRFNLSVTRRIGAYHSDSFLLPVTQGGEI
jgi:hypothetical protein